MRPRRPLERRLTPAFAIVVFAACLLALHARAHGQTPLSTEPVTLDVAVIDDRGQPVGGLERDDFSLREDGRPVPIESVRSVSAGRDGAHRQVVLVLDDTNVNPIRTVTIQRIAKAFVARANAPDTVSVAWFSHPNDELTMNQEDASARISSFRAGSMAMFGANILAVGLREIARFARLLVTEEPLRKLIVCIGAPGVFDMPAPPPASTLPVWGPWVDSMHATARANVSVYVVDPSGLGNRMHLRGGLAEDTGGASFVNSNDFDRDVDRIWSEAGHYYLLSYRPFGPERVLHSIEVGVRGRGLHVHARHYRGDFHRST